MANHLDSDQAFSGVAQTANLGTSTSVSSGAAKIFREFKWGLLTLFILMAVVVGLVYDGGRGKKADNSHGTQRLEAGLGGSFTENSTSGDGANGGTTAPNNGGTTAPSDGGANLGGGHSSMVGGAGERIGTIPNRNAEIIENPNDSWNPEPIPGGGIRRGTQQQPGRATRNDDQPSRGTGERQRETGPRDPALRNTPGIIENTAPHAPTRAVEAGPAKIYVVKSGDSLSKISSTNNLGKNGIKLLLDANKEALAHPDRLREGMKLRIPGAGATPVASDTHVRTSTESHPSAEPRGTQPAADTYTVQVGDSLERIARRVLNDSRKWKDLLEWNKDRLTDPTKLKAGMVLRVHGMAGVSTPAMVDSPVRYQNNAVRAQHEMVPIEDAVPPEREVERIPVSPVSASRKVSREPDGSKASAIPEPDNLGPNLN